MTPAKSCGYGRSGSDSGSPALVQTNEEEEVVMDYMDYRL